MQYSNVLRTLTAGGARVAATTLAATALLGAASAHAAPPVDLSYGAPTPNAEADPFYTPPASIPAGDPGDVIRARRSNPGPGIAKSLAQAWQVMYLSTDAIGQRNVVTGTVLVPFEGTADSPVVAMAPGTTGPAFRCTVSRFINSGAFYEQATLNALLEAKNTVVVTDYEGYHENPDTSYVAGRAMGAAVLDGVRAAARLPQIDVADSPAKVVAQGYSQGGGASLWAAQMQPTYAPEINLVGVAAGGVPANLAATAITLDRGPHFGFLLNALIGLDNGYPELDLGNYMLPSGNQTLADMAADDCTIELLLDYPGKTIFDYAETPPFATAAWQARLIENVLGKSKIEVPVFQYHGTLDKIVPLAPAKKLRDDYCRLGSNVTWKTFDVSHITGVVRGKSDAIAFLADRIAGLPATPNCGT